MKNTKVERKEVKGSTPKVREGKKLALPGDFPRSFFITTDLVSDYSLHELPVLCKEGIASLELMDDGDAGDVVEYRAVRLIHVSFKTQQVVEVRELEMSPAKEKQ